MNVSLFHRKHEKDLPPSVIGKCRPITWTSDYSHVLIKQDVLNPINGCVPGWNGPANTREELESGLVRIGIRIVEPYSHPAQDNEEKAAVEVEVEAVQETEQVAEPVPETKPKKAIAPARKRGRPRKVRAIKEE